MKISQLSPSLLPPVSALLVCLPGALVSQSLTLEVANPLALVRTNEPVVIPWAELHGTFDAADHRLRLVDEKGRSIAFQIDDLDVNGTPDELVFQTTIALKGTRRFLLTVKADTLASPEGPLRTDAEDFKRIAGKPQFIDDDDGAGTIRGAGLYPFDGVGWESEQMAYRLYLDERNSIDIQGKRIPGLHWKFIGESRVDYQRDAYWGMDVLHVGSALGVGGMSFWENDSVNHPYRLDRRRTRIIARGPVRAIVRVDYDGWRLGEESVDVTSLLIIYAGDRMTEHRVLLRSGSPKILATGIVRHPPAHFGWDPEKGILVSSGPQSRAGDGLMMALSAEPSSVVQKTKDSSQELLLLRLKSGTPLRYLISAYWQGETGRMWSDRETKKFLDMIQLRLTNPLHALTQNERQ